jgi:hypothetical protein
LPLFRSISITFSLQQYICHQPVISKRKHFSAAISLVIQKSGI